MDWQTKAWGRVQHVFLSPFAAISVLEVDAGTRCSRHHHRFRANEFKVLSGRVLVEAWDGPGDVPATVAALLPGESISVPSGIQHRFRVHEAGRMVEIYTPDTQGAVSVDDIIRVDEGGKDPEVFDRELWIAAREAWLRRTAVPVHPDYVLRGTAGSFGAHHGGSLGR